jgi:hypothetical protein
MKVDEAVHIEIATANDLGFARVQHAFKWLETPGRRCLSVEAPEGGPAAVAYVLVTGPR